MPRLTSITTRSGDAGQTGLGDGTRVPKTHPRITVLGELDELNAALGVVLIEAVPQPYRDWLLRMQNDLFDLGGELCFPVATGGAFPGLFQPRHLQQLDDWLEQVHPLLAPLENFILPGGGSVSARLHWGRTVCRRAERSVLLLAENESVPELAIQYLNRLSDLLFQLARLLEDPACPTPLWQPAQT